jgi:hypothetical protein
VVSTHFSVQTGPEHSCRHTRSALAGWESIAAVAATAAIASVLNIILMEEFLPGKSSRIRGNAHGRLLFQEAHQA